MLSALVQQPDAVTAPLLRRERDEATTALTALATLHVNGTPVDWSPLFTGVQPAELPTYAFQRQRYWLRSVTSAGVTEPAEGGFWSVVERGDLPAFAAELGIDVDAAATVLPALSTWRARGQERSLIDGWRYRAVWRPIADPGPARIDGAWLLLGPDGEDTDTLAEALTGHGATVRRLPTADTPIGTSDPGATRAELVARVRTLETPLAGVLAPAGPLTETLAVVQALGDAGITAPLWLLTRGAVTTGTADPAADPRGAETWGFGRVLALEHPDRWGGLIDLPARPDARTAARLAAVLAGRLGDEAEICVRSTGLLVRRLTPAPRRPGASWEPTGTVLVTGGTGGLGRQVARWAAEQGARRVVLVGRRGPEADGVRELAAEFGTVEARACDLTDRDAVAALVREFDDEPDLAIVHAAGVLDDGVVAGLDPARLDTVLAAKSGAAWQLHELTEHRPVSAFVLFSSTAGVFGNPGQANYAAANAALDALAEHRAALALPATSIAWGPWAEAGMMADHGSSAQFRRTGLSLLRPAAALAAMAAAVGSGESAVVVADVRWDRFAAELGALRPASVLADLPEARTPAREVTVTGRLPLAVRLADLPPAEARRTVLAEVREQAAIVLGHGSADAVASDRSFQELGFDSLTAMELRNRLAAATGVTLPAALVFDYPDAERLADFLLRRLVGTPAEAGPAAPTRPAPGIADDPVVITGLACRFPGGADSPEQLWDLLASGTDAMGGFPTDRGWDLEALYHPDPEHPGTTYTRTGGFVTGAGEFDAGLFGISPREALAMDPQQRLLLETSWEAFEHAGIDPLSLRGEQVGVFAGTNGQDYVALLDEGPEGVADSAGHIGTGNAASVLSGRVSYTFGLEGPAVTVDTACSSSLVALHLAAQALRGGECSMALVGGATVMATPTAFVDFSRQRGLAADGRCKSFGADADGTAWGEGAGVFVVERLSTARAAGRRVLAVVRGTAVNQDGASNGLTAPNGPSQQRVIRAALAQAGLDPQDVDVVEAHGTGTSLGDPIEAEALLATYGRERSGEPLWLGSVKSNIGHTQAAAGVAGIIKMVLAMRHETLPATLHADEPSPHVDWSAGAVELLAQARPWPAGGRPRRAGVSSFGISGTNAHVILEEAPVISAPDVAAVELPLVPVLLSGRTPEALRAQAERLRDAAGEDVRAFGAASVRRAGLAHRAVVLAGDRGALVGGLDALASGAGGLTGRARPGRVAFLFTGQGAQRVGMGRGLYEAFPVFADAFDAVALQVDAYLERPLAVVLADEELIHRTEYAQPALFAVEVASYALLRSWGVEADVLVGHSIGEIAAAHVAGVLSLADAAVLVTARGRLMQALPSGGAMLAVGASEGEVREAFPDLDLAAVNGPASVVVSGPVEEIEAAAAVAAERGWKASRLRTSHAFHSRLMDPMLDQFRFVVGGLEFAAPKLPVVSTVTGRPVEPGQWSDPEYWVRQVREPVRFADALAALDGVTRFVELGPDGVLSALVQQPDAVTAPLLRRERDEVTTALTALATLYVDGVPVDWRSLFGRVPLAGLPTYAFQRERFWPEKGFRPRVDHDDDGFWAVVEDGDADILADRLGVDSAVLADLLPALAAWRARGRERSLIDGWRYRDSWTPAALTDRGRLSGTWLLVGDDRFGLGELLAGLGADVTPLPTGSRGELADLLADRAASGVVTAPGSVGEALALVQALADAGCRAPLWVVTRRAVATGRADGAVDVDQAQLWGFGRAVGLEHPDFWGGLLDLPAAVDSRAAGRLGAVLSGVLGAEDQVAIRSGGVLVRRLAHAPAASGTAWRPRGTVLITGGTGGLGAEVARWAAGAGAERLVLVSRRGLGAPGAAELAAELPNAEVHACDLADRSAVEALLAVVGGVDAVVHAAGVAEDVPLVEADRAHLDRVIRGKVDGALHLDELVGEVDAFVVFSSISATWGSSRQAAYGAANTALDALVLRRRAAGLPGTSVAWGPWASVGMAAGAEAATALRRQGLVGVEPRLAVAALASAVGAGDDLVTVADVRWAEFLPLFTAARERPLLADLPEAVEAAVASEGGSGLAARLGGLPSGERRRVVLDLVRSEVARALGHASVNSVEPSRAFKELGFDSLTAVELRNRLQAATGLVLPATLVFDYPDAERLAAFVLGRFAQGTFVSDATVAEAVAPVAEDPIVIVGMGLRLPGGVETPESFWELVASGGDGIGGFPSDRGWDLDALYHPDPEHVGTSYTRHGGFLYGAGEFDAGLFGISPREALAMDPQQRLLLETSWEALESAGADPLGLRGEPVGVFVGASVMGYGAGPVEAGDGVEGHLLTGTASSVMSGRISYSFGLEGPAVTVDTACSSSLVALHLAAQALRAGECSMALVGGVTVMPTPDIFVEFSRQRGLAADGRCKSFGAGADGTGWSEGAGMLLVERLSSARAAGRRVLGVVRGTAVNQDGASNGLTAPNGPSQQRVIRAALAQAGLSASEVDAVEAHGTGTSLGDPIEAQALLATYGRDRSGEPLWLGSVKSNIGHTQAAAGVAGIIKVLLAMRHEILPATLHADEPSPHIDWTVGAVELLTEARSWEAVGRPRRAGVSAFGVSGTNAHVIIEEPPTAEASVKSVVELPLVPVLLSGDTPEALRAQAERLRGVAGEELRALGAASVRRAGLAHRAVVLASDRDALTGGLDAVASGAGGLTGTARPGRVAFLFTGQGAQRVGMGRGLYEAFPVFADAFDQVALHLDAHLDRPLAVVLADEELIHRTEYAQPAIFAVEVALHTLLAHWGVAPDVLLGHSIGEIAAAHVAGVLSLADAAMLVTARGRIMQQLPSGGAMLAVGAAEAEALEAFPDLDLAAVNGSASVVLSGPEAAIDAAEAVAAERGWKSSRLRTSHAFHSRLMDPMLDEFRTVVAGLAFADPSVPVVSSVTARPVEPGHWSDPEYWVRQVREPVRFSAALEALEGVARFVELGPDGVLSALVQQPEAVTAPLLRRDRDEATTALTALATLHVNGTPVDWSPLFAGVQPAELPTYAFQRQRYWLETRPAVASAADPAEAGFWATVDRGDLGALATELGVDPFSPLASVLPALTSWRARGQERSLIDGWRYRVTWQPVSEPGPAAPTTGTWVLVGADPVGLAEALAGQGARVLVVESDVRSVLAESLRALDGPIAGVVSFAALGCAPLLDSLAVVQACLDAGASAPLWFVTRGAVATGRADGTVDVEQAQVWGLGRAVGLEHPEFWGGLLDLPADLDRRAAARIAAVLGGGLGAEDQVAVRGGGVLVRRLVHAPAASGTAWRPRGTVLIAGGTGGLGAQVARWAAGNGAERLVLVSRRGVEAPGADALLAELPGAEAHACDLADREAVAALLGAVGQVDAVVHAAGVSEHRFLAEADEGHVRRVVDGKVLGALHLDELVGEVDAFVVFSSISGVWGSGEQAAYGAANAALDALVARRRARGLPGTAIAWGPWAEVGMAADDESADQLRRRGLNPMEPRLAVAALASAVGSGDESVTVADVRWAEFLPLFTAARERPLLADLPEAVASVVVPEAESGLAARMAGLSPTERRRAVLDVLRAEVAAALGHTSADEIEPSRAFKELGFDSLTAVELRNRLRAATGLALPATLAFDHPSAERLADHLLGLVAVGTEPGSVNPLLPVSSVDDDPVVIVGMGLRLPGGVDSPERYWDLLAAGGEGIGAFPTDRGWDLAGLYHPDPDHPGTYYAREAGFLAGAGDFDAALFGISPREALAMDPQQRLLLETSWEAFERAGVDPRAELAGRPVGVFVGAAFMGYGTGAGEPGEGLEGHLLTGTASSVMSGRISYSFGLEGPAVTVDTACSSSLVALHLAAQALRAGECSMALVGGVTVMPTPDIFVEFSRQRGLAADGRCKSFGAGADGTGWSEGAGMLLVERLSAARAAGRRVLGVVRGTAVNQDGASNGLTAPNGPSQQRVIRAALAQAGLDPRDVDVVEAHGTGTSLGDPIEAQALLATYGQDRDGEPLWLGSVKSNIGHTQAAAGVAGIIKMVLAMRHETLPATLHADEPSPHVDWSAGAVELLTEARSWEAVGRPRRAGVSAFGVSGTNAHVIIEEPPTAEASVGSVVELPLVPVLLSGDTSEALRAQAERLRGVAGEELRALGAASVRRAGLAHRAVVLAGDRGALVGGLDAVASGAGGLTGRARPGRVAFLFTGQGAQRVGMGCGLYEAFPVFADAFDQVALHLDAHLDRPLAVVLADEELIHRTGYAQPAIFAVEVALHTLLSHWGVAPDVLLGHSIGEIAAAHVAGVLSLADAAALVTARGRLMQALPVGGAMLAVGASEAEALEAIPDLDLAAVNGSASVVLSGPEAAIDAAETVAAERGWKSSRLRTSHAFHSRLMDPMLDEFRTVVAGLTFAESSVPVVSSVTGRPVEPGQWSDPEYWVRQVREPVRFADALAALDGVTRYVELGPDGVLSALVQQPEALTAPLLRRDRDEATTALTALATLHVNGTPVDWSRLFTGVQPAELPTYAFQRQRYWLEFRTQAADVVEAGFWDRIEQGDLSGLATQLGIAETALEGVVPALADWRAQGRERSTLDGWRYHVTWEPQSEPGAVALSGTWVLVGEVPLAAALERHGATVVAVPAGADLRGLDAAGVLAAPASVEDALALVRAMAEAGSTVPLWFVTRGAVATGRADSAVDVGQAQLWGFGRAVGLEHPELWGGLLDLPEVLDHRAEGRIAAVLGGALGAEDQVAVRSGGVLVRRLVQAPAASGTVWRPRGTVLVAGGTGGLGAEVARWAAGAGAERLVLVSRRGLGAPGAAELVAELPNAEVHACDLADRSAVEALLAVVGPVDAVVHAAGVAEDVSLVDADAAHLDRVIRGKVDGALHLDELVGEVDAFVVFSSISGVWGSGGQAAYGAANAALDGLVARRRARGLPGTAVAWGPWAEVGMASDGGTAEQLRRRGLSPMEPARAMAALASVVGSDEGLVVVADVRWGEFLPLFSAVRERPLFARLAPGEAVVVSEGTGLSARLAALSSAERRRVVLALVRAEVAAALGHTSADEIEPSRAFKELGFDSLTAVELRNRLRTATGLALPATLAFDHPSAERLAEFVLTEVGGEIATPVAAVEVTTVAADDPIVIVGMGLRLPGGVETPESFWELVASGRDGIGGFPSDRGWDLEGLYHPDPEHVGTSYTRHGGFLYGAGEFDAGLFGISPREALAMDPQQRLLLETSWEALEAAGADPLGLRGEPVGVFVGASFMGYGTGAGEPGDGLEGHLLTGTASSVMSGRISYTFGLEGPAVTVDTACSSSLVALHLAAQALRGGECSMALVGGVTVMPNADVFVEFSRQRGLAADGRCKSFGAGADGTGWSEGAGMLLVERLSSARAAGRRVLGVVRGTAVNQDGASNGLTAPNGPSQQRVIRAALAQAGLDPQDVDVVEAHGTGTSLGDPIEAQALLATYGQGREGDPLWLGSVKSNIGHTQAAAGVAGIIKMVLAMRHETLPATLHADEPSPHIDWTAGAVELLTEARPWEASGRPRRAGVSAFGVSGTNAHVIIEESLEQAEAATGTPPLPLVPVPLAGHTAEALRAQAERLRDMTSDDLPGLAAAAARRSALTHRAVVLASDRDAMTGGLDAVASGAGGLTGRARPGRVAFLFTGQGAQRVGMGRGLYEAFPVFADAFDQVALHVDAHLDRPLAVVLADEELIHRTEYAQPAIFAVEVALHTLLAHWGVAPDVLLGHSIGEIAAAHVAGVLPLADAAMLVTARGRLMQQLPSGGAMLAVGAAEAEALEAFPDLDLAAVNGSASVVLSGPEAAIDAAEAVAAERGWKSSRLRTSHAFHSRLMDPMLDEFRTVVSGLAFTEPTVPAVSSVTGCPIEPGQWSDPEYWVRQVREPVRFADALNALDDVTTYAELGPDGVLSALVQQPDALTAPLLRRERDEATTALTALAGLWVNGTPVDWSALHRGVRPVDLPPYAFQRRRYWLAASQGAGDLSAAGLDSAGHPLLGAVVPLVDGDGMLLTGRLSLAAQPWLADHVVGGAALLPGTALLELAVQAAHQVGCNSVEELTLHVPLVVPDRTPVQVQVTVDGPDEQGRRGVRIHSRDEQGGGWRHHATGSLAPIGAAAEPDGAAWPPADAVPVPLDGLYAGLRDLGLEYGPAFQALRAVWRRGDDLFAEVLLDEERQREASRFGAHPVLVDAALHALSLTGEDVADAADPAARLPFSWSDVTVHATGADRLRVRISPSGGDAVRLDAFTAVGQPVLSVGSLVLRPVPAAGGGANDLFAVDWARVPAPAVAVASPQTAGWAVLGAPLPELPDVPAQDAADAPGTSGAPVLLVPAGGRVAAGVPAEEAAAATHAEVRRVLEVVQRSLAGDSRVVVLTRNAVRPQGDGVDLAGAAVWGLLRSAQQENPDRFLLVDLDGDTASWRALPAAVAADEPQLAVRGGALLAPRLARAADPTPVRASDPAVGPFGTGTVLITGGSGTLAGAVARHLVATHGVSRLVLVSRSGGGEALAEALRADGAHVTLAAADVTDRAALAAVLAGIPAEHPLSAVVHTAGVLADGIVEQLTSERLARVLRPKVDGALLLHELTRDLDLSAFVLFSSASAVFGTPGQANYAAANGFLDALAQHRRALGLPGQALAWGPWAEGGMAGDLDEADRQRMARAGVRPFDTGSGLAAFDAAVLAAAAPVVPIRLDLAAVRAGGDVPPLLAGLVRRPAARAVAAAPAAVPVTERLAGLSAEARRELLLDLVHGHMATVLGHPADHPIEPDRGFLDQGFDSLTAVELRNGLTAATGLRLPATAVFDYPTPADLAGHLYEQLAPAEPAAAPPLPALAELDRFEASLADDGLDPAVRDQIADRLRKLLAGWEPTGPDGVADLLSEASDDEMFAFIDNDLGLQ
ncbi:type I polyketide synthase [Kitasatospora sp. NPDC057500]|uniref:type I polyketide synthase n=1 Tax=Kitasatospora sp. NPDC057500 TaxID=3346151 RepID=UPI0036B984BF